MPTLTLSIPHSAWAKLEKAAQREGVTVRTLCIFRIREAAAECVDADPPDPEETQAAA